MNTNPTPAEAAAQLVKLPHTPYDEVRRLEAFILSEIYFESNSKHLTLIRSQEGMRTRYGPMLGPQWSSRFTHAFSISVDHRSCDRLLIGNNCHSLDRCLT